MRMRNRTVAAVFNGRSMWRVTSFVAMGLISGSCFLQGPPPPRPEHTLETLPAPQSAPAPGRGGGAPGRGVTGVAGTGASADSPGEASTTPETVVSVASPDMGGKYRYNARFEPPRGRIIHGMGQWQDGNAEYLAMLDDPKLFPAVQLLFAPIGDWPRPWEWRLEKLGKAMAEDKAEGRLPHLDITLKGIDSSSPRDKGATQERSIDHEVASSDRYDSRIRDLARLVRDLRGPVFVRIGGEFSGDWNGYHAYEYPKAYRKVVELFRAEGVDNVAFVWCYEPSGPDDFDVKDARGWRWFPGDDVIDWYGLDVFELDEFVKRPSGGRRVIAGKADNAERFLKMARDHGKPVVIAECSASRVAITPDVEDGRRDWQEWFVPFLEFMANHPEIQAFHYINYDWRNSAYYKAAGWLDARMTLNSYISQKWIAELRKSKYLHAPDIELLNGYAEASVPLPTGSTASPPKADVSGAPPAGSGR